MLHLQLWSSRRGRTAKSFSMIGHSSKPARPVMGNLVTGKEVEETPFLIGGTISETMIDEVAALIRFTLSKKEAGRTLV